MLARLGPEHLRTANSRPFASRLCHNSFVIDSSSSASRCRQLDITSRTFRLRPVKRSAHSYGEEEEIEIEVSSFKEGGIKLPTQGESLVKGMEPTGIQVQERERDEGPPDFAFLSVCALTSCTFIFLCKLSLIY